MVAIGRDHDQVAALDRFTHRLETSEARTSLAISQVENLVREAFARLDITEREQQGTAGRIDGTTALLAVMNERIHRLDAGPRSAEALRMLEERLTAIETSPRSPEMIVATVQASGPYTNTATGPTTVNFEASATPGATIASVPGTLLPATDYTAVVAGLPGAQQAFLLQDQNFLTPSGGDRLRFVNASAGSNPVDASVNGTQLAANVAYGTASAYATTSPATVTIAFTDAVTGAVLASQDGVVLTANQTSSVYLIGPPGAQGVFVTQDN